MNYLSAIILSLVFLMNVSYGMSARLRRAPYCTTRVDLAFVIDSSRSIHRDDFARQIQFVHDIVNFLDVGPDETRVAAVSFSNHLFPQFKFNDYSTKQEVLDAIGNIDHSMGDATRTYLALEHTYKEIFAPGNGERPEVVDVVVVLTDGETNPGGYDQHWKASGKKQTQIEALRIKARPAYVFAIGVGSEVNIDELNGISSDPDERFTIQVSSFKELNSEEVKRMLLSRACIPTTTPPPTTTTTPKPKEQECKEAVADIFFVLDESSSIKTQENFQKELNFVTGVVDYLEIGPTKSQVGVMTFSDTPKMKFHLNKYNSREDIADAVHEIKWNGGNTYLDRALAMLRRGGLNREYGSRSEVPQIGVIITDGVSTDPAATRAELNNLHSENYLLFAVGVGPDRNKAELELIANDPRNVFEVESLDGLQAIRRSLAVRLCVESARASAVEFKKP